MFRKLPEDCNLHVFSFLSSADIIKTKTIDKRTEDFANRPLIWKTILKNEFFDRVEPEERYKELRQKISIENKRIAIYLPVFLFFIDVKKQMDAGAKLQGFGFVDYNAYQHNNTIHSLDNCLALNRPPLFFTRLYEDTEIYGLDNHDGIGGHRIQEKFQQLSDPKLLDKETLCALAKLDIPTVFRVILNKIERNQLLLDELLHTACSVLNLPIAKLLIEFGANVNATFVRQHRSGGFMQATCLSQIILTLLDLIEITRPDEPENFIEKAKLLVRFLLKNSADPDKENSFCFLNEEEVKINSLHENCVSALKKIDLTQVKDPRFYSLFEIFNLIISASKLISNESAPKKMRI